MKVEIEIETLAVLVDAAKIAWNELPKNQLFVAHQVIKEAEDILKMHVLKNVKDALGQ